jgi:threonine/homoserine/homoserine lactone efflux protein
MSWAIWSVYVVAYALVCLTPGPAVLFVTNQSAWRGRSAGLKAAAGIATANIVFWMLSALGLAAAISASQSMFMALKWGGAACLAWLGMRAIAGSFAHADAHAPQPAVNAHAYRDGLFGGLSNPKGIFSFVALLPQFIDPSKPALAQIVMLAATSVLIDFPINAGYALAADQPRGLLTHGGAKRWLERGVGGAFLSLAAATALYPRAA